MDEATTFATKAELEQVRKEQKRMAQRLEGIDAGLTDLTKEVAHLSERVADLSEGADRFEAKVDARFDKLEKIVADGIAESRASHQALTSVILRMGKK